MSIKVYLGDNTDYIIQTRLREYKRQKDTNDIKLSQRHQNNIKPNCIFCFYVYLVFERLVNILLSPTQIQV